MADHISRLKKNLTALLIVAGILGIMTGCNPVKDFMNFNIFSNWMSSMF